MDTELKELPIGKSEILREGGDVALLAFGTMVPLAMEAAERLANEGVEVKVVNARFAKPLDTELLDRLNIEGTPVVTIERGASMAVLAVPCWNIFRCGEIPVFR